MSWRYKTCAFHTVVDEAGEQFIMYYVWDKKKMQIATKMTTATIIKDIAFNTLFCVSRLELFVKIKCC